MKNDKQHIIEQVRDSYANVALADNSAGCSTNCCNTNNSDPKNLSMKMGYSQDDVDNMPEGANMGLGCGNPKAIANLKTGETVLDLGSGGGFDCFLASKEVGETGSVIGIDMTPEMVAKARRNAEKFPLQNVNFRLGEIEQLPVADDSVDVIISNCVINLSTDKLQVFKETYRVLKKHGRIAVSDIIKTAKLPEEIENNMAQYSACVSGASDIESIKNMLQEAGFSDIQITPKDESKTFIKNWTPGMNASDFIVSANIEAVKTG